MNGSYGSGNDAAAAFGSFLGGAILCYVLFILLLVAAAMYIYYKIFQKTGNSGWLALLMLIPLVNLGMIIYLAFSDWPILRENRDLRARLGLPPQGYPPTSGYSGPVYGYVPPYAPPAGPQPSAPVAPPQAPSMAPQPAPQPAPAMAPQPAPQPAPSMAPPMPPQPAQAPTEPLPPQAPLSQPPGAE